MYQLQSHEQMSHLLGTNVCVIALTYIYAAIKSESLPYNASYSVFIHWCLCVPAYRCACVAMCAIIFL